MAFLLSFPLGLPINTTYSEKQVPVTANLRWSASKVTDFKNPVKHQPDEHSKVFISSLFGQLLTNYETRTTFLISVANKRCLLFLNYGHLSQFN